MDWARVTLLDDHRINHAPHYMIKNDSSELEVAKIESNLTDMATD
jgi:hypothetical protein